MRTGCRYTGEQVLRALDWARKTWLELARGRRWLLAFRMFISSRRALEIADDPMPVPPDVSPAHALITGWRSMTDAESRRVARALAKLATCVYPDSDWHIAASLVKARAEQA